MCCEKWVRTKRIHTAADLRALIPTLRAYVENGIFCAVGGRDAVAFVNGK